MTVLNCDQRELFSNVDFDTLHRCIMNKEKKLSSVWFAAIMFIVILAGMSHLLNGEEYNTLLAFAAVPSAPRSITLACVARSGPRLLPGIPWFLSIHQDTPATPSIDVSPGSESRAAKFQCTPQNCVYHSINMRRAGGGGGGGGGVGFILWGNQTLQKGPPPMSIAVTTVLTWRGRGGC